MTSVLDTVIELKRPIQQWTRGWMLGPSTEQRASEIGLVSGEALWVVGRAGVLGSCPTEVAAGGLAYLAPAFVARYWEHLPSGVTHLQVAQAYADLCSEWGESELPRFGTQRLERLDNLARRVIDAAPASLGSVFAGWRALPVPQGVAGRVALSMHVLREMRGAASVVGITAVGLTPLQAVLASPAPPPRSGPEWAKHLGWEGPFEDPAGFRHLRERAEEINNEVLVPYFGALNPSELSECADLLTSIRNDIDM